MSTTSWDETAEGSANNSAGVPSQIPAEGSPSQKKLSLFQKKTAKNSQNDGIQDNPTDYAQMSNREFGEFTEKEIMEATHRSLFSQPPPKGAKFDGSEEQTGLIDESKTANESNIDWNKSNIDWNKLFTNLLATENPETCKYPNATPKQLERSQMFIPDTPANPVDTQMSNREFVVEPTERDVLLGRGGRSNHHPGNQMYRQQVDKLKEVYRNTPRQEKTKISQRLVDHIQSCNGRFLRLDAAAGKWYAVPNSVARKKASQALREINTAEFRSAKRAKYSGGVVNNIKHVSTKNAPTTNRDGWGLAAKPSCPPQKSQLLSSAKHVPTTNASPTNWDFMHQRDAAELSQNKLAEPGSLSSTTDDMNKSDKIITNTIMSPDISSTINATSNLEGLASAPFTNKAVPLLVTSSCSKKAVPPLTISSSSKNSDVNNFNSLIGTNNSMAGCSGSGEVFDISCDLFVQQPKRAKLDGSEALITFGEDSIANNESSTSNWYKMFRDLMTDPPENGESSNTAKEQKLEPRIIPSPGIISSGSMRNFEPDKDLNNFAFSFDSMSILEEPEAVGQRMEFDMMRNNYANDASTSQLTLQQQSAELERETLQGQPQLQQMSGRNNENKETPAPIPANMGKEELDSSPFLNEKGALPLCGDTELNPSKKRKTRNREYYNPTRKETISDREYSMLPFAGTCAGNYDNKIQTTNNDQSELFAQNTSEIQETSNFWIPGHPNIFIRYEEALGNERCVNLSLRCCSIICKDDEPTTNHGFLQQTNTACHFENSNFDLHNFDDCTKTAMCFALCINVTLNYPNLQPNYYPNLQPNSISYVLPTSSKKLLKPNWELKVEMAEDPEHKPNIASAGSSATLQHMHWILNEIRKDECTQLAGAMWKSNISSNFCRLNLDNSNISDDLCTALCGSTLFENSAVTNLSLRSNQIGRDGCLEIANILRNSKVASLLCLDLGCNHIGDAGCIALFNALKDNTSLINLNLEGNGIGDEACDAIGNALDNNYSLVHLNLENNQIGDYGCIKICQDGLDYNMSLQTLNAKCNRIGDDGCEALLSVIETTNTTLANVDLSNNNDINTDIMLYFQQKLAERNNHHLPNNG